MAGPGPSGGHRFGPSGRADGDGSWHGALGGGSVRDFGAALGPDRAPQRVPVGGHCAPGHDAGSGRRPRAAAHRRTGARTSCVPSRGPDDGPLRLPGDPPWPLSGDPCSLRGRPYWPRYGPTCGWDRPRSRRLVRQGPVRVACGRDQPDRTGERRNQGSPERLAESDQPEHGRDPLVARRRLELTRRRPAPPATGRRQEHLRGDPGRP